SSAAGLRPYLSGRTAYPIGRSLSKLQLALLNALIRVPGDGGDIVREEYPQPRSMERIALQVQLVSHCRHCLQGKGNVIIQRDPKISDPQINILAVDAARESFVFELLFHRGDLHV